MSTNRAFVYRVSGSGLLLRGEQSPALGGLEHLVLEAVVQRNRRLVDQVGGCARDVSPGVADIAGLGILVN